MARRGVGSAIADAGKPLKRKPKKKEPVSSALRRGPLEKPDLSKPQREAADKTRKAKAKVQPSLPSPAGRGDAPQTRKSDSSKAAKYKRSKGYRDARRSAVVAARKQALRRALEALAEPKKAEVPSALERAALDVGRGAVDRAKFVAENAHKVALLNPIGQITALQSAAAERSGIDVDKELSGEGEVAKLLSRAGDFYRDKGATVSTGAGPGLATRAAGGGRMPRGAASLSPHAVRVSDMPPVFGNFGANVFALPTAAVSSVYVPAKAGVKAAGGDPTEAREYLKGIQESDPVYAAGEAAVRLASGDTKGAGESISRAGALAEENPLFTALEVAGFAKGASRGVSRTISGGGRAAKGVGRATGSEALQRAGERAFEYATPTNRPDAVIPGTTFRQRRRYSRGIVGKRAQVRRDAKRSEKAQAIRDEAQADAVRAQQLRDHAETLGPEAPDRVRIIREADRLDAEAGGKVARAALIDPEIAASRKMGAVNRRVDVQREIANEGRLRLVEETDAAMSDILRGPRTARRPKGEEPPALNPIAQAIVKADVDDLRAYRTELEAAYRTLPEDGDFRAANVKVRETLTKAIEAEEKRPGALADSAERARRFSEEVDRPLDEQLVELGIITAERAAKAKVIPFAARAKGAVVDEAPRLTEAGQQRAQAKAGRQQEAVGLGQAQRRLGEAQRRYVAAVSNVRVAKAAGKDAAPAIRKAEEAKVIRDAARDAVTAQQKRTVEAGKAVRQVNRDTKGRPTKAPPGLVDPEGRKLQTEALIADISRERDAPASFVGQKLNVTGGGSFYRDPAREPVIPGRARTEKATVGGLYDPSVEAMRASGISRANMLGAAKGFRDAVFEFAQRDKNGEVVTIRDRRVAERAAEKATRETGIQHTAINALPWERNHASMMLAEAGLEPALAFDAMRGAMLDGLEGKGSGSFVIVPEAFAARTRQHVKLLGPGDGEKIAQAFRGAFSRTVLSTSLSPLIGNMVEAGFRTAVLHAGPLSYLTWRRVIKTLREMDPEAAAKFEHAVIGRGKVTYEASSRYMNADQFDPVTSPNLRAAVRTAEKLRDVKGVAVFPAAWRMWTHFVFEFLNNRMVERPTQRLQAGKAIRDSGLLGNRIIGLGEEAITQAAKGLTETKQQVAFANALRDSFGAYRALPPWQKRWISTYTPFVAWWLNSARFIGIVLPRDHPVLMAITAQALQVVDDVDRQQSRPGWLRGTMVGNGVQWQATRNTPFGAFTDPEKTFAGLFLPQVMPVVAAMAYGIDWKGKPLRNPDGTEYTSGQLAWYVAQQVAASSVPAYAVPDRAKKYYEDPGVLLNAIRVRTPSDASKAAEPRPKTKKAPKPPAPPVEDEFGWMDEEPVAVDESDDLDWMD